MRREWAGREMKGNRAMEIGKWDMGETQRTESRISGRHSTQKKHAKAIFAMGQFRVIEKTP